ncbi:MAG: hypothetical protein Q9172_000578 [Xanthocarpia lactea]
MWRCKALVDKYGEDVILPEVFGRLDRDSLSGHSVEPFDRHILLHEELHLIACVHFQVDIDAGWKNGLLALALQRFRIIRLECLEPLQKGYRAKFDPNHLMRNVYAKDIQKVFEDIKNVTSVRHRPYDYWKNYSKASGTSSSIECGRGSQDWPRLDKLEAYFKAALCKWYMTDITMWVMMDEYEIASGGVPDEE